jgi:hypothetical protein
MLRNLLSLLVLASPLLAQATNASARAECMITVVVPPGQSQAFVSLPVDSCDSLQVLTAFGSEQARVQFVQPNGSVLPWASGTPGLAFGINQGDPDADGNPGSFAYQALVANPSPGNWSLQLQWPEAQWAGAGTVVYATFVGSRIEMNVFIPGVAFPQGTPVNATLALMENRQPRYLANITANLFKDNALVGPVTFTPLSFPDLPVQSLVAPLPVSVPGHYVLWVEATGLGATGPFRRTASNEFDVYVPTGAILGTFTSVLK